MIISRQALQLKGGHYDQYIGMAAFDDLVTGLKEVHTNTHETVAQLDENILNFRYEPGKWTIKEIIGHMSDTERIFAYRALRFARMDTSPLAGFNENSYVEHANFNTRTIADLLNEMEVVRQNTIVLFESFNNAMLDFAAIANHTEITPRALGFAILGHQMHHLSVIKSKYLSHFNPASV
jgi:hypothetical protein